MTARNIVLHVVGLICILGGGAWLFVDVRPDGHVEFLTAGGVSVLLLIGGFLIDKAVTLELLAFLKEQASSAFTLWRPPPGGAP